MFARLFFALPVWAFCALHAFAADGEINFAVTEGVTYQSTPKEIRDKFAPLAEAIARATNRRVNTVILPAYNDLRAGLAKQEYDMAFVHPAHVSLAEIKAGRYKAVAWTIGYTEYAVSLLMPAQSPFKTIADLKGKTLVTPDPDSITAAMVRAMFRTENIPLTTEKQSTPAGVRVITTRYQDSAPFYIDNGFAQVAATASNAVVKGWTDIKGGKVLAKSRAVPIKQIIVSTKLPADEQQKIAEALLTLGEKPPGRAALEALGYKGFVKPDPGVESATIAWLGL